ncbi:M15 family metallopeptidase [Paenibacillus sp. XY044]|uniref:M15 family metallopeptidase n=1 Tax=Paenibacillus sp. XY044 TaxID=2026089 RepID=UPI000B9828D9|nr:M15 family metallopeptidase [Paenibacillus sp. XY044]OZB95246.1 hypothetical protein CJP46_16315 [Paenibacillus sp. XY044]
MRKWATLIVAVIIVGGALIYFANSRGTTKDEATVENPPALAQGGSGDQSDNGSTVDPDGTSDAGDAGDAVSDGAGDGSTGQDAGQADDGKDSAATGGDSGQDPGTEAGEPAGGTSDNNDNNSDFVNTYDVEHVVSNPTSDTVLVNKTYRLPEGYVPPDLVYPDVAFTFSEKIDKRKMRKVAADALKELFDAAKQDGVYLAGVSGYRSESRQTTLYNNYVDRDGVKAADTYSARPGHSEHQTGLTIDVSGTDGKCAAESCFAGTKEANWLADHAYEYGFIIRYPEGKESITGYKYEPWHIRYVGKEIAEDVTKKDITLEQYFGSAVPVSK